MSKISNFNIHRLIDSHCLFLLGIFCMEIFYVFVCNHSRLGYFDELRGIFSPSGPGKPDPNNLHVFGT